MTLFDCGAEHPLTAGVHCERESGHPGLHTSVSTSWDDTKPAEGVHNEHSDAEKLMRPLPCSRESPLNGMLCMKAEGHFGYHADALGKEWGLGQPIPLPQGKQGPPQEFSHYYRDVSKYTHIDIYRILDLFEVTDPCIQHAIKKLVCGGKRGNKAQLKDVQEAIVSLQRFEQMHREDE